MQNIERQDVYVQASDDDQAIQNDMEPVLQAEAARRSISSMIAQAEQDEEIDLNYFETEEGAT